MAFTGADFYAASTTSNFTITPATNDSSYGTVSLSGSVITATPEPGYRVSTTTPYAVSPSGSATVINNGDNTFTVTPSADCTVTINFELIPTYTATFIVNGATDSTLTLSGTTITLPSSVSTNTISYGGNTYTFAGWAKVADASFGILQNDDFTTQPADYYAKGTTGVALSGDTIFRAVYVWEETGSGGTAPDAAFSPGDIGDYAIVSHQGSKYYALPTEPTVSSGKITAEEITVSDNNGVLYVATSDAVGFTWTISSSGNYYLIADSTTTGETTKYIYHSNGGSSGTDVAYGTSTTYKWKFVAADGAIKMYGVNNNTENTRGMLFSGTTIGGYSLSNWDSYDKTMILPIGGGTSTTNHYLTDEVAAANQITVSYYAYEGATATTKTATKSSTIGSAVPDAEPTAPMAGWIFVGWAPATFNSSRATYNTLPSTIYTTAQLAAVATGTTDMSFYAVWASGLGDTYELVTTVTAGEYVIGTVEGAEHIKGLGAQGDTNRASGDVLISGGVLTYPMVSGVTPITIAADGAYWTMNDGTGYLYAASTSANQLKVKAAADTDNALWSITITDGKASIVAKDSTVHGTLRYNGNNSTSLFNCYASADGTTKDVALYKKTTSSATKLYTTNPAAIGTATITWSSDGSTFTTTTPTLYTQITAPSTDPTKAASGENTYAFQGWSTDGTAANIVTNFPYATGNATYTAVFEATAYSYTTAITEGGSMNVAQDSSATLHATVTATPERVVSYSVAWNIPSNPSYATLTPDANDHDVVLTLDDTAVLAATFNVTAAITYTLLDSTTVKVNKQITITVVENPAGEVLRDLTLLTKANTAANADDFDFTGDYVIAGRKDGTTDGFNKYTILTPHYDNGVYQDFQDSKNHRTTIGTEGGSSTSLTPATPNSTSDVTGYLYNSNYANMPKEIKMKSYVAGNPATMFEYSGDNDDYPVYNVISEISAQYAFHFERVWDEQDETYYYTIRVKGTNEYLANSAYKMTGNNVIKYSTSNSANDRTLLWKLRWATAADGLGKKPSGSHISGDYNWDVSGVSFTNSTADGVVPDILLIESVYAREQGKLHETGGGTDGLGDGISRALLFNAHNADNAVGFHVYGEGYYHYESTGGLARGEAGNGLNLYLFGLPNPFVAEIRYHSEQITEHNAAEVSYLLNTVQLSSNLNPDIADYADRYEIVGTPTWSITDQSSGFGATIDSGTGLVTFANHQSGKFVQVRVSYMIRDLNSRVVFETATTARIVTTSEGAGFTTIIYNTVDGAEGTDTAEYHENSLSLAAYIIDNNDNTKTSLNGQLTADCTAQNWYVRDNRTQSRNGVYNVTLTQAGVLSWSVASGQTAQADTVTVYCEGIKDRDTDTTASTASFVVRLIASDFRVTALVDNQSGIGSSEETPVEISANATLSMSVTNAAGTAISELTPAGSVTVTQAGSWSIVNDPDNCGAVISGNTLDISGVDRANDHTITLKLNYVTVTDTRATPSSVVAGLNDTIRVKILANTTRYYAVDDAYTIDFAMPAELNVLANDRNNTGASITALSTDSEHSGPALTESEGVYSIAGVGHTLKIEGNKITFTPSGELKEIITFNYTATGTDGESGTASDVGTVTITPANAVFYEDSYTSLFTYADGLSGAWTHTGTASAAKQTNLGSNEAEYESAVTGVEATGGTLSTAHVAKYTGSATEGRWPTMTFSFTGSGFIVYTKSDKASGMCSVYVDDEPVREFSTTFGMSANSEAGERDSQYVFTGATTYYGVPVIKWTGTQGEHTVRIEPNYRRIYDTQRTGAYDVHIDGVRIYSTAFGSATYTSFRDTVLAAETTGKPEATPTYNYHYYVDGTLIEALSENDIAPTFPTPSTDVSAKDMYDYRFVGWAAAAIPTDTATAPTLYTAGSSYSASADTDFYAVFSYPDSSGAYTKVTTDLGADWRGNYVIVNNNNKVADGRASGTNGIGKSGTAVDPGEALSGTTITEAFGDTYHVTLKGTGAYTSGSYFLVTQDGKGNYLASGTSGLSANVLTNATVKANPVTVVYNNTNSAYEIACGASYFFRCNPNGSNPIFRYYSSGQGPAYLFKQASTTKYATTLQTKPVPTATVTALQILDENVDDVTGTTINATVGDTVELAALATATTSNGGTVTYIWSIRSEDTGAGASISYDGDDATVSCSTARQVVVTAVAKGTDPSNTVTANVTINFQNAGGTTYSYALNIYENGVLVDTLTANNQSTGTYEFTLPAYSNTAVPTSQTGYTFAGWRASQTNPEQHTSNSASIPAVYAAGDGFEVTGDSTQTVTANVYAMYTTTVTTSGSATATLYTATGDLPDGDYVITSYYGSKYIAMKAEMNGTTNLKKEDITSSVTSDTTISNPDSLLIWHIEKTNGYYTVYNAAYNSNQGGYMAAQGDGTTYDNKGTIASSVSNYARWTISDRDNDYPVRIFTNLGKTNGKTGWYYGGTYWGCYSQNNSVYQRPRLFKYTAGGSTTNYYYTTGDAPSSGGSGGSGGSSGRGLTKAEVTAKYSNTHSFTGKTGNTVNTFPNWGSRGETATFLTSMADSYYSGSYSYSTLIGKTGGCVGTSATATEDASVQLYSYLQNMLTAKRTANTYDMTTAIIAMADCVEDDYTHISCLYSGASLSSTWDSGTTWNREHTWPNSKINGNGESDAIQIRGTSSSINNDRGSKAYGTGSSYYNPNIGSYDVRGDVARIMLYVYVAYGPKTNNGDSTYYYLFDDAFESLAVLKAWMDADPVDTWEMGRNDVVQSITGVRNPFVDYPELFYKLFNQTIPQGYKTPSEPGGYANDTTLGTEPVYEIMGISPALVYMQAASVLKPAAIARGYTDTDAATGVASTASTVAPSETASSAPATRATYPNERVMYFDASSPNWWLDGNASLYVYAWGNGVTAQWFPMTLVSGSIYKFTLPAGNWTNMILGRFATNETNPTWDNAYNRTNDINLPSVDSQNYYRMSSGHSGEGEFSKYYYVDGWTWSTYTATATHTGAVVIDGQTEAIASDTDIKNLLATFGPKNALFLPANGSICFKFSGGSTAADISIGASALTGTATALQVIQVDSVDENSVTGTLLVDQALSTSTEMYYRVDASLMSWAAGVSKVILIRNAGPAPMMLTNLRSGSGATESVVRSIRPAQAVTMIIDDEVLEIGSATAAAINDGTFNELPSEPTEPANDAEISVISHSISLKGQIDVNFYVSVPAELIDAGVYAELDGVRADLVPADGAYRLTKALPAKQMNTKVTLRFFNADGSERVFNLGGADVTADRYSVQDYLQYVIANSADADLVKLCKAMSDYGAAAQRTLGFDVDNAKDYYLADEIAAVTASEYGFSYTPRTANIALVSTSLLTKSETAIRFYFDLTGDVNDFTATVDGEPAEIRASNGLYFVEIANISAKDLGKPHTATVTKGDEAVTVSGYSAYSYVNAVLRNPNASEANRFAAQALKFYGDLAAAYFARTE